MEIYNLFRILLYVSPIQNYLYLKMALSPVLKAGSSGNGINNGKIIVESLVYKSRMGVLRIAN